MRLLLGTLTIAIAVGYLLGGRLSGLADLSVRWGPLALIGLTMQTINPPGSWPLVMLTGSFVLLWIFAVVNRDVPGFRLIMVGIALNFLVIVANGGMPVSADALVASGQADTASDLTDNADRYVKHHLAGDDDLVLFLGDVIPLPPPVSQAISLGDIFTYAGVGVVVVSAMRGRRRERSPSVDPTPTVGEPARAGR
ncbi:MAG TPA: DUF5317 domain-containing protein [Actinomycetota bacterium]